MASVYNKGTKDKPEWYIRYKDLDGQWKGRPSHVPGRIQANRIAEEAEERVAKGLPPFPEKATEKKLKDLFPSWEEALKNRSKKDDKSRAQRHVYPVFGDLTFKQANIPAIITWIDDMRAGKAVTADVHDRWKKRKRKEGPLEPATMRKNLNLLSRFFSWAVLRGHTDVNPIRQIPRGTRPEESVKSDTPWTDDASAITKAINALPEPINFMFYLANRSGIRNGEAAGLRMSDFGFLKDGTIRVRFSYTDPLKEDKKSAGKIKWVPAPTDAEEYLKDWLIKRKSEGAQAEDLVFPNSNGVCFNRQALRRAWNKARGKGKLDALTWYQASRHSFVSRNLSKGASLDEVSSAVGHSSPTVTRRYYDHFIRKTFSDQLREGLGLGKRKGGKLLELKKRKK